MWVCSDLILSQTGLPEKGFGREDIMDDSIDWGKRQALSMGRCRSRSRQEADRKQTGSRWEATKRTGSS